MPLRFACSLRDFSCIRADRPYARALLTMITKTHAIALRIDPYSRTSHVVSWLCPDKGRITTLVKGALRNRSAFLGQYDLFYTCELVYYPGVRSSLGILKECTALKTRPELREDWKACVTASYLADLLHRLTPAGVANGALYLFAGRVLDFLADKGGDVNTLHWAELKLLELVGVGPSLTACVGCGSREFPSTRMAAFSIPRGGLLCQSCRGQSEGHLIPLQHDTLAMMRGWQVTPTPMIAKRTSCTLPQRAVMEKLLGGFLTYHLESSRAREIAMDMLQARPENIGPPWTEAQPEQLGTLRNAPTR